MARYCDYGTCMAEAASIATITQENGSKETRAACGQLHFVVLDKILKNRGFQPTWRRYAKPVKVTVISQADQVDQQVDQLVDRLKRRAQPAPAPLDPWGDHA